MNHYDLTSLLGYNEWANKRIYSTIKELTVEQLNRPLGSSFPTILATLSHIIAVEWVWLQRWQGVSPKAEPKWSMNPSVEELRHHLDKVEKERAAYFWDKEESDLKQIIHYVSIISGEASSSRLDHLVRHVVNHSTYHRGQIVTMMRQVDATPPATDMSLFYKQQNEEKEHH